MTAPFAARTFAAPSPAPQSFQAAPPPQYEASSLTRGGNLAHISLNGQLYSLRITRQGKLILTK